MSPADEDPLISVFFQQTKEGSQNQKEEEFRQLNSRVQDLLMQENIGQKILYIR